MTKYLNERQKRFCVAYALNPNATLAAISAGYPKEYARAKSYLFLKNPKIQKYIKELISDEEKYFFYSRVMSFKNLEEAQRLALERKIVKIGKDGQILEFPNPELASFLKAEELKGKLQGLYIDKSMNLTSLSVNSMGSVKIDNDRLELKIGREIEEKND